MPGTIANYMSFFKNTQYCFHGRGLFTQTTKVSLNASFLGACIKQLPKAAVLSCLSVRKSVHFSVLMEQLSSHWTDFR
jgi:hypothetical protein